MVIPISNPLIPHFPLVPRSRSLPKTTRLISSAVRSIRSEVSFSVGTHLIPHPNKVDKGGEDAFLVSSYSGGVLAVADGVSGWAEQDVNPALFPRELMANASNLIMDEKVNDDPQILMREAHAATFSIGSATVIIAMLEKTGVLKIANVGDCGLRILRQGQVIFTTPAQEHYFDCPYQLSSERIGQTYRDAMGFDVPFWKKVLGMKLTGGKLDDITVIVGRVVSLPNDFSQNESE